VLTPNPSPYEAFRLADRIDVFDHTDIEMSRVYLNDDFSSSGTFCIARERSVWSHSISHKRIAGYGLLNPEWWMPQCVCAVPLFSVSYEALLTPVRHFGSLVAQREHSCALLLPCVSEH
jgi:hypothetical protein